LVDRSSFFSGVGSVFHAGGAATEKAVSSIRRRVRGTTTSPDDEARSEDLHSVINLLLIEIHREKSQKNDPIIHDNGHGHLCR